MVLFSKTCSNLFVLQAMAEDLKMVMQARVEVDTSQPRAGQAHLVEAPQDIILTNVDHLFCCTSF